MFNKVSIRMRLTIMCVGLLMLCCTGLTFLLNNSADRIVEIFDASLTTPAQHLADDNNDSSEYLETSPPVIEGLKLSTQARSTYRTESIAYMILIIIGGGVLTYYVSGKALKPLKQLNEQVKKTHANNLSESLVVPTTHDEIAELTRSFNEMTDKLDHAFHLQQQFSSSAAHELKTPLAVLQTKVDVFRLQDSHDNLEYEALISVFEKQIYRLRGLVSNLLSMTQTDYEDEKTTIYLKDIFIDIYEEIATLANQKNITLSIECDGSTIYGNLDSLYRAFYNLIENGIKYNLEGGAVTVTIKEEKTQYVFIKVSDTGVGIPDDCKKDVFESFFCVDKSRSRAFGGAGLGLALVKHIVEQHNGSITVVDNKPCGSTFTVIFPLS